MRTQLIFMMLISLREVYPASMPEDVTKYCEGGSDYGLANVNVCASNCDANCCGILGSSNTLCGNQVQNIANNITLGQLVGLCAQANGGSPVCSASAATDGAACVLDLQYLKQVLSVCQLGVIAPVVGLLGCMEANGLVVSQLVACCSSNDDGDVTCTGNDFCSNTANSYIDGETYCCTVECGYYD